MTPKSCSTPAARRTWPRVLALLWALCAAACAPENRLELPPAPTDPCAGDHDTLPRPGDTRYRQAGYLQLASFNVDWLWAEYGGGFSPRNAVDYRMIGELIVDYDLDLLALQEINTGAALSLLELPPRYKWVVGTTGWSQNLAVLYRADLMALGPTQEIHLPGTEYPSKDPLRVEVRPHGGTPFTLIVVHLHPYGDAASAAYRRKQIQELRAWIAQNLPADASGGRRVVLAGDFNDTVTGLDPSQPGLALLLGDPDYRHASAACQAYTEISFRSIIDHIVISADLAPRHRGPCGAGGCWVVPFDLLPPYSNYTGGQGGTQNISTHRPLWIYLTP